MQRETIHGVHEELFPGLELELSELLTSVRVEWRTLGLLGCAVPLGAEVFAAGEPEALALLRERARVANRTGEHTFSFDLRFGDVPADVVRGLVVGTPLAEAAAARLVDELGAGGRFLGVAAAGGGALWTDAHQTSFVQDCDIELGMSGISLPDPYVGLLTTGVSAACSARPMHAASPTLGNRLLVSLELRRRAPLGPIRQVRALTAPYGAPDTSGPVVVTMDLPESELHSLALTLPVVPARWTLVDLATRGARAEVVLVRVSELPTPW